MSEPRTCGGGEAVDAREGALEGVRVRDGCEGAGTGEREGGAGCENAPSKSKSSDGAVVEC